jgi:hypothetical protein
MSKNMKLIMESWRKATNEQAIQEVTFESLVEKIESLEELDLKKLAIIPVAAAAFGMSPDAAAGGINKFGAEDAPEQVVQQAGDLAASKASSVGQDKKAFQNADALSDYIVAQPQNVDDANLINLAMDNFGWSKAETYDAYTVLNSAINAVEKAPAKPEKVQKATDGPTQKQMRQINKGALDFVRQ